MVYILITLMEIWKRKTALFLPLFLFPTMAVLYSMGQPVVYEAETTLHLDQAEARSPLLKNMLSEAHQDILSRTLHSDQVIYDAAVQASILPSTTPINHAKPRLAPIANSLDMAILDNDLIRLRYKSEKRAEATYFLEIVATQFVRELLAPERFRLERQMSTLSEQIKYYNEQQKLAHKQLRNLESKEVPAGDAQAKTAHLRSIVTLEFETERLQAQKELAQEEYDNALRQSKTLMGLYAPGKDVNALWYVESPILVQDRTAFNQHISYGIRGALAALLTSLALVWIDFRRQRKFLQNDADIKEHLGLRILGSLPDMGDIKIEDGRLSATIRTIL